MNWRPANREDLAECFSINPAIIGDELVGERRALDCWQRLLESCAFHSAVIESGNEASGLQIVGFGATVFVSRAFAACEAARPASGLNARIVASIASHRSVVLTPAEVGYDNTFGGLHVVFLSTAGRTYGVPAEVSAEIEALLAISYLDNLRGYRLRQALREATNSFELAHMRSQRVFGKIIPLGERALGVSTRTDALAVPGSIAAILFSYHEPVLGLHEEHQQLLLAALHGMTDEELSRTLLLKLPAIKKRWASVFRHVAEVRPDLLPEFDQWEERKTRGPQKRHRLLEYLRSHPEELRPLWRRPATHW